MHWDALRAETASQSGGGAKKSPIRLERIWTLPPECARPRAQQAPAHLVRTIASTLIRLWVLLRPGTGALRPRRVM